MKLQDEFLEDRDSLTVIFRQKSTSVWLCRLIEESCQSEETTSFLLTPWKLWKYWRQAPPHWNVASDHRLVWKQFVSAVHHGVYAYYPINPLPLRKSRLLPAADQKNCINDIPIFGRWDGFQSSVSPFTVSNFVHAEVKVPNQISSL